MSRYSLELYDQVQLQDEYNLDDGGAGGSFESLEPIQDSSGQTETQLSTSQNQVQDQVQNQVQDPMQFFYQGDPSSLQTFNQIKRNWTAIATQNKQQAAAPKVLYVNAPADLFGKRVGNKKAIFQAAAEGAGVGGSLGSIIPGVGNIVGSAVGGVVSTIGNLFKGDQRPWFDVVFKDAIKGQLQKAGLNISNPYSGSLTERSQFKVNDPLTRYQVQQIVQKIAQQVSKKMADPQIRSGLAGIQITDRYDKHKTLFAFEAKPPEKTAQQQSQELASQNGKTLAGPGQFQKAGLTFGAIVLLVLAAGSLFGSK